MDLLTRLWPGTFDPSLLRKGQLCVISLFTGVCFVSLHMFFRRVLSVEVLLLQKQKNCEKKITVKLPRRGQFGNNIKYRGYAENVFFFGLVESVVCIELIKTQSLYGRFNHHA